nr:MAG: hypothetical protein [Owegonang virus 11]
MSTMTDSRILSEEGSLLNDSPPTDRPTDTPDSRFKSYLSIRLTIGESQLNQAIKSVFHDVRYIIYRHEGKEGKNPHYHVLLPDDPSDALSDKMRNRIKRLGFTGNKYVSIKLNHNGLLQGIQYCSHEGTEPAVSGPELYSIIAYAPKWVQKSIQVDSERPTKRSKPASDPDWQLTYTNLVSVAVKHARENSLTDKTLRGTVSHLIQNTRWRPSKWLVSGGVPEFYENDYLMRLGKRKEPDMNWWTPRSI